MTTENAFILFLLVLAWAIIIRPTRKPPTIIKTTTTADIVRAIAARQRKH